MWSKFGFLATKHLCITTYSTAIRVNRWWRKPQACLVLRQDPFLKPLEHCLPCEHKETKRWVEFELLIGWTIQQCKSVLNSSIATEPASCKTQDRVWTWEKKWDADCCIPSGKWFPLLQIVWATAAPSTVHPVYKKKSCMTGKSPPQSQQLG